MSHTLTTDMHDTVGLVCVCVLHALVGMCNYRCSLMGFDLNRHWHDPSPWVHPTLCATKELVIGYDRDPVSVTIDNIRKRGLETCVKMYSLTMPYSHYGV